MTCEGSIVYASATVTVSFQADAPSVTQPRTCTTAGDGSGWIVAVLDSRRTEKVTAKVELRSVPPLTVSIPIVHLEHRPSNRWRGGSSESAADDSQFAGAAQGSHDLDAIAEIALGGESSNADWPQDSRTCTIVVRRR